MMWIKAMNELLVEGAKVRGRPLDEGESGRILAGAEGVVIGYARGNIYIDFDIEHGALILFNVKRREYETLEVWVEEESL